MGMIMKKTKSVINIYELDSTLGLTHRNLNIFEFKFDDTRLCSLCKNKIDPIEFFLLRPDIAKYLPCYLLILIYVHKSVFKPFHYLWFSKRLKESFFLEKEW